MNIHLYPLSLALLLLGAASTPLCAAPVDTSSGNAPHHGSGLHDISDPELNALRGRYTVGNNAVAWFGVKMISTWHTSNGQILQGTLSVNMNFGKNSSAPQISFQPSVNVTSANADVPMPTTGRSIDSSGLANINGVTQSVQVAGSGNFASNIVRLNVRNGDASSVADASVATQGSSTAQQDNASARVNFDGHNAAIQLDVEGAGTVQQWIRNGSLGQSVQLAADNQSASNLMEIDLVRQSLSSNTQLSQSVAQAITLTQGIGIR